MVGGAIADSARTAPVLPVREPAGLYGCDHNAIDQPTAISRAGRVMQGCYERATCVASAGQHPVN